VANLQNIPSADNCQKACKLLANCQYFLYDINVKLCQLFDAEDKVCSVTVGPATPSYEECKVPEPTTAPPIPSGL